MYSPAECNFIFVLDMQRRFQLIFALRKKLVHIKLLNASLSFMINLKQRYFFNSSNWPGDIGFLFAQIIRHDYMTHTLILDTPGHKIRAFIRQFDCSIGCASSEGFRSRLDTAFI